jgi:hypothetical protein
LTTGRLRIYELQTLCQAEVLIFIIILPT